MSSARRSGAPEISCPGCFEGCPRPFESIKVETGRAGGVQDQPFHFLQSSDRTGEGGNNVLRDNDRTMPVSMDQVVLPNLQPHHADGLVSRCPKIGSSSICVSRSDRASQIEGIRPWYRRSIGLQPPAWRLVRSASLRRVHGSYLADWLRMASALSAGRLHGNDMVGGTGGSRTFPLKAKRFGSSSGFVDGDV